LMRHYGLKRSAAAASGIIFSFSGYLLSVCTMNTTLSSVVWLPLVILFWDKLLGIERDKKDGEGGGGNGNTLNKITNQKIERNLRVNLAVPLASITAAFSRRLLTLYQFLEDIIPPPPFYSLVFLLSLMFLGGEPTMFYSTVIIMVIYAFSLNKAGKIPYLIPIIILAAGLLAVQLLPFFEYLRNSVRMWRTEFDFISHSSFPPREILNFIIPDFFGNFLNGTYTDVILGKDAQTWILSPYMGVLPLFFAGLALLKRSRIVRFYFLTAVLFLFLAFGFYTPVYKLFFYALPGISAIRYPIKFLFFPAFAVAIMAGWGLNDFEELIKPKLIAVFGAMTGIVFGFFLLIRSFKPAIHQIIYLNLKLSNYYKFILAKLMSSIQNELMLISLVMIMALALMLLSYKKIISGRIAVYGILLLIIFDLFMFNFGINPPISSTLFTASKSRHFHRRDKPNIESLIKDRSMFRFYVDSRIAEKSGTYFKSQDDILFSLKAKLAPNLLIPYHLQDYYGRESIEPLRALRFYWAFREDFLGKRLGLLSLANVKYVLSYKKLADPRLKLINNKDYYLYENLTVVPRAFIKGGVARIVKYEPMMIKVEVRSKNGGKLILSDNYYPGWKAYLDGKEAPIERSEYLFRAVKVPEGAHKVSFVYDPLSVKIGAAISLLTLCFLAGSAIMLYARRKNA
ncbi:MAG: YfhO family protein, partial [Candidatus Margulisiibacteriota bacterium]